jgi:hypothetical protein
MKLTQFNTKIFVQELETLIDDIEKVNNAAKTWLDDQENRSLRSQWTIQMHRETLENNLNDLRYRLATVYDFQGDRGMVDFLVGSLNGHPEEVDEEDDTVIPEILKGINAHSVALLPAVWPFTSRS